MIFKLMLYSTWSSLHFFSRLGIGKSSQRWLWYGRCHLSICGGFGCGYRTFGIKILKLVVSKKIKCGLSPVDLCVFYSFWNFICGHFPGIWGTNVQKRNLTCVSDSQHLVCNWCIGRWRQLPPGILVKHSFIWTFLCIFLYQFWRIRLHF